jgi:MoaA/NifB/PqqE/SkfB family radical SAM enzyme
MQLTGLHLLLTYQCTLACDHCFVWGSPWQTGTLSLEQVQSILDQAQDLGTVRSIYFEGGEPFLYYPTLLAAVRDACVRGFSVGIVSNGYWATGQAEALEALRPLAGLLSGLSISSDRYHWGEAQSRQAGCIRAAAEQLGLPLGTISIAEPDAASPTSQGQLPAGESAVMYRGRAVEKLAGRAPAQPWERFDCCPHEDLRDPGRVHVDPLGNVHLCQGISIGNLFATPLRELWARFDPDAHPIAGPLLAGGPAELARRYDLPVAPAYADACHLCDAARRQLRSRFPAELGPDQMYGVGVA